MEGFIKLPRALEEHPAWTDARLAHKAIFMTILQRTTFKKTTHNVNGNLFDLEPGQLCASIRNIAKWSGKDATRDDVVGTIKYFIKVKFLRQQVRQGKTVLTICDPMLYESITNLSPTAIPTDLRQTSDTKEDSKEINPPPPLVPTSKEKKEVVVDPRIHDLISFSEKRKLPITSIVVFNMGIKYGVAALAEALRVFDKRTPEQNIGVNSMKAIFIKEVQNQAEFLKHKNTK